MRRGSCGPAVPSQPAFPLLRYRFLRVGVGDDRRLIADPFFASDSGRRRFWIPAIGSIYLPAGYCGQISAR
ncbi:MAG: hypothetical protein J2P48_22200, partial [Alphaproteobacteria bacterium]|nr:hypothetical protein [Alphaproteobacteria bacterium]